MKVPRRLIALAGLLRRTYTPVSWQTIRDELAPIDAYTGDHSSIRKQIQRDCKRLRTLGLNAPYRAADGGYLLDEASRRPRQIELNAAEASLLRQAGALVWRDTASPFAPDLRGALERLEAFDFQTVDPLLVHHRDRDGAEVKERVRKLVLATWRRLPVSFDYQRPDQNIPQPRALQPWGLYSHRGRWHVVGADTDRQATRTFRLSRMSALRVKALSTRAPQFEVPADFDLEQEANAPRWDWCVHTPVEVVLQVDEAVGPLVQRQFGGVLQGGQLRRSVTHRWGVWDLVEDWLPRVRVVEPRDLAVSVEEWLASIRARAGSADA